MKERILVEGKYTVRAYRKMLDDQSGIPGLPGVKVHKPDAAFIEGLQKIRQRYSSARVTFRVSYSLIDGGVELVPAIEIPPFPFKKGGV